MKEDLVILVDEHDKEIGVIEKLQAHKEGKLHRAVSVFIFNSKKELLLQKRAAVKYHSPNLWTNTCCSHPKPKEATICAAKRRLQEEMGISCDLKFAFNFIYKAELENNLIEHEFDHVFIGYSNELPKINLLEASDYKYVSLDELQKQIEQQTEQFTVWFKLIFEKVKNIVG